MASELTDRVDDVTRRVKEICNSTITSPILVSRLQLEIENEILQLRLDRATITKQRSLEHYKKFRSLRWGDDMVHSYNEASAGAKAESAEADRVLATSKAYVIYFENLSSILKAFINAHFRDA